MKVSSSGVARYSISCASVSASYFDRLVSFNREYHAVVYYVALLCQKLEWYPLVGRKPSCFVVFVVERVSTLCSTFDYRQPFDSVQRKHLSACGRGDVHRRCTVNSCRSFESKSTLEVQQILAFCLPKLSTTSGRYFEADVQGL